MIAIVQSWKTCIVGQTNERYDGCTTGLKSTHQQIESPTPSRDDRPTLDRVFDKTSDDSTRANTKLLAFGEPGHESVLVLGPQSGRFEEGMSGVSANAKHPCQAK